MPHLADRRIGLTIHKYGWARRTLPHNTGQGRKSRGRKRNRRESPQLAPVSGVPRPPRSLPRGLRLGGARLLAENLQDLALVVRRQAAEAARDLVLLVDPLANLRGVV